jgi:cytidylate kinase
VTRPPFATRFEELLGTARVASILASLRDSPVMLLAGGPGTGKSALAARLAELLGRPASGTGAIVRAAAAASGRTLAEYNRRLELHPEEDAALDARAAAAIARGDVTVFESRLAGHLGAWLRAHGRRGLTSIVLRCDPHEQARRLLAREASPRVREELEPLLKTARGVESLDDVLVTLRASRAPLVAEAVVVLEAQASRIKAERARMLARYGVVLDDPSVYDAVLDTSRLGIAECASRALRIAELAPEASPDRPRLKA